MYTSYCFETFAEMFSVKWSEVTSDWIACFRAIECLFQCRSGLQVQHERFSQCILTYRNTRMAVSSDSEPLLSRNEAEYGTYASQPELSEQDRVNANDCEESSGCYWLSVCSFCVEFFSAPNHGESFDDVPKEKRQLGEGYSFYSSYIFELTRCYRPNQCGFSNL